MTKANSGREIYIRLAKFFYGTGKYTDNAIAELVDSNYITPDDYKAITGKDYPINTKSKGTNKSDNTAKDDGAKKSDSKK